MINILIACDENDLDLGNYFHQSYLHVFDVLDPQLVAVITLQSIDCTEVNINLHTSNYNGNPFIFIGLSHGNEEQLVSHEVYVSESNAVSFANSIFYTCACLCGSSLAQKLIEQNCSTFVGYNRTVYVIEDFFDVFLTCQNFAIRSFLTNDEPISVSVEKMKGYYDDEIDRLVAGDINETIAAANLVSNRNCLVLLGNGNLTRSDLTNG
ncbi:MAG TPA: hypothetical protein VGD40_18840 [Chryseosolibacter sp.]